MSRSDTDGDPWLLGIEIGGTKLQLALAREPSSILSLERIAAAPDRGAEGIRRQIAEALPKLLGRLGLRASDIAACGVGFGGPVRSESGRVVTSNQVAGWDDFPLADWVERELGIPRAVVHNDADTAALAEARLGAGKGFDPVLYVNSGSGIGGGLVLGGRIYRGGSGLGALEIGHIRVGSAGLDPQSLPPRLEEIASGWAIGRCARERVEAARNDGNEELCRELLSRAEGRPERITAVEVARAADARDPLASDVLATAATAFGRALAAAITLLAPRRVVLGGGVSLMPERLWLEPVRRATRAAVYTPFQNTYQIVVAGLGEDVVVHGALLLARDLMASPAPPDFHTEMPRNDVPGQESSSA